MEKLQFETEDGISEFYVLDQTRINETDYLLVSESPAEDEDTEEEVIILKDISKPEDPESIYELLEDEDELLAVFKVFEELAQE
ncbi:MAG: DUF1292 domain-containing protein [Lachnospiraceae bacterium]|nr:DUF1292 domain-containing protein [Lachnospiraceae bacterium]